MFPAWIARIRTRLSAIKIDRECVRRLDDIFGELICVSCSEGQRSIRVASSMYACCDNRTLTAVVNRYEKRGYKVSLLKSNDKEVILLEW